MKNFFKQVVKPFLPTYEVICTNYQIVPGLPVNKNQSKHKFKKGAAQEAIEFYSKVVSLDLTKIMAPVEIQLKKRGRVIQRINIGPVEEFKNVKFAARN